MNSEQVVLVFPGQGGYAPGCVEQAAHRDPDLFEAIRSTGIAELGVDVAELLGDERPLRELAINSPRQAHLAIYLSAVVAGRTTLERSPARTVLVGHSFGEIAALVVGGALRPTVGAQVVARRMLALEEHAPADGRMSVFVTESGRADAIVRAVGAADLVLAGVNATKQVVLSGPDEHLQRAEAVAKALGITSMRIASAYAFHNPQLAQASSNFARALSDIAFDTPTVPVFSPILGRFYAGGDDLANCLAQHLTTPFDFSAALDKLATGIPSTFVECGAGTSLSAIVRGVRDEPWHVVPVDDFGAPELGSDDGTVASLLNLRSGSTEFQEFWHASAADVTGHVRAVYDAFRSQRADAAPQAPTAPVFSDSGEVSGRLARLYADALEYPVEVFLEDPGVHLEADLGVDSVKQTDLLARAAAEYGLPVPEEGLSVAEYPTFGSVVDLIATGATKDLVAR
ncbi:MAG: hypothetical protein B5766_11655 [Candidatus Lumbricidophila eiseniae]|uniref:[acyl-carrier-protein] S-malonyltransferase n=1 Tax=Candidatus Lumbricidiphila eiseniae TaxID=1969409 RepID=A0A2A6FNN0_9MICO|nr:MAG: hypothetical protein B5766_11655 [Candidatus Lumbricidophila eiseniae]